MCKKILTILNIIILVPTIVFAEDSAYNALAEISNTFLSVIQWVGYAIAIGILILIGIKYMFSAANEKANLKGKLVTYAYGVALIVLCSVIAGAVAKVANSDGKNTAEGMVEEGVDKSGVEVVEGTKKEEEATETWPKVEKFRDEYGRLLSTKKTNKDGSYSEAEYADQWGYAKSKEVFYNKEGSITSVRQYEKNGDKYTAAYYKDGQPLKLEDVVNDRVLPKLAVDQNGDALTYKFIDHNPDDKKEIPDKIEYYNKKGEMVAFGSVSLYAGQYVIEKTIMEEGSKTKVAVYEKTKINIDGNNIRIVTYDETEKKKDGTMYSYNISVNDEGQVTYIGYEDARTGKKYTIN